MKRTLLLPLFLSVLSVATSASAQDAEAHVQRGVELRRAGDDEGALAEFRAAYELDQTGRVLGQMGFAEQALGMWVEAATHLGAALATSHEWVESHRAPMVEAFELVVTRVGRLEVRGGEPGAEVLVDGEVRGTLPLSGPLFLEPGTVVLRVRAEGFEALERSVTLTAGQLARESITLRPAAAEPPSPPEEPDAVEAPRVESSRTELRIATGDPEADGGGDDSLTIVGSILLGLGVVTAGVLGTSGLVIREDNVALFNMDGDCYRDLEPLQTRAQQCPDLLSDVRLGETLAGVGFAVGGAMAVVGAILIGVGAGSGSGDSAGIRCDNGPGDVGVACGGTF